MTATRRYRLGVLAGDGIGPEVVPAAVQVLDAATAAVAGGSTIDWVPLPLGADAIAEYGTAVPDKTLQTLAERDGWLLGPTCWSGLVIAMTMRRRPGWRRWWTRP
jgi:3-isopropylmalate dehydrogenase